MKFIIPKEVSTKIAMKKGFLFIDLIILIAALIVTSLLDPMVYAQLRIPYYIFSMSVALYLVLNSRHNIGKKNYQSIYYYIKRERETYHKVAKK